MAALARRRISSRPVRRPSPQIAKLKERLKAAGRRARGSHKSNGETTLCTMAGAAAFAMLERKGVNVPTVGGLDPAIIPGAIAALVLPRYVGGKNGQRVQAAGDGILAYAAARAVQRGGVKVSGVEIGADDDDDLT